MRNRILGNASTGFPLLASAMAIPLTLAGGAIAAEDTAGKQSRWDAMREEVVSAEIISSADVYKGDQVIGEISKLVLNEDSSAVQYVLYEVRYPFRDYPNEAGFSTFGAAQFNVLAGDSEVRVDFDAESLRQAPEELELTASEADHRLVSNVIGSQLYFAGGESLRIVDLLVDRDSGEILHYVVATDAESLFDLDRRAIPAETAEVDDGGTVRASMKLSEIRDLSQPYDTEFL